MDIKGIPFESMKGDTTSAYQQFMGHVFLDALLNYIQISLQFIFSQQFQIYTKIWYPVYIPQVDQRLISKLHVHVGTQFDNNATPY